MLTINGKQYAANDKEFTASLFNANGTAYGFYKAKKNGVLLMDMQKTPFAFVVNNRHNEQFFVSCGTREGRIFYLHSTTAKDEEILGLDKLGYIAGIELAQHVIKQVQA